MPIATRSEAEYIEQRCWLLPPFHLSTAALCRSVTRPQGSPHGPRLLTSRSTDQSRHLLVVELYALLTITKGVANMVMGAGEVERYNIYQCCRHTYVHVEKSASPPPPKKRIKMEITKMQQKGQRKDETVLVITVTVWG